MIRLIRSSSRMWALPLIVVVPVSQFRPQSKPKRAIVTCSGTPGRQTERQSAKKRHAASILLFPLAAFS